MPKPSHSRAGLEATYIATKWHNVIVKKEKSGPGQERYCQGLGEQR